MKIARVLSIAVILGIAIPAIFLSVSALLWRSGIRFSEHADSYFFLAKIMIWPTSFPFMMLTENTYSSSLEYKILLILSIFINVIIYCVLASLIYFGFQRFRPLLYLVGIIVLSYWIFVLTA